MHRIKITAGDITACAVLNDTPTAEAIWKALPIEARGNRWGDEIYFSIPVKAKLAADARQVVEVGELGYWPPGQAFCIFFGPTPASQGDEVRAASPVNIIGRVEGEATDFRTVPDGARVVLEMMNDQ